MTSELNSALIFDDTVNAGRNIEPIIKTQLLKLISSQTKTELTAETTINKFIFLSTENYIILVSAVEIDGGTPIQTDFEYPLSVIIIKKLRNAEIKQNVRCIETQKNTRKVIFDYAL